MLENHQSMRAIMYMGPEHLEMCEIPIPNIAPEEILVRVHSATTCGTDVKTYLRGHPKYPPPFMLGHEFAGDIVEIGARVKNFKPGMRVTASCFGPCGTCYLCRHHQENLCENMVHNFAAYADYVKLPEPFVRWNTLEIPEHMTYPQAALLEPLASVVHGHLLIDIKPGERVAILGAGGPVGLMHLQMAIHRGAAQVIAVDLSDERLAAAGTLGASAVVNPRRADPVQSIRELTGGRGADVVIECAGAKETWEAAVRAARKGGRVLWFGGLKSGSILELDAPAIHYGEIALLNTHGNSPADFWQALELVSTGIIKTKPLLSGEMPLEQTELALQRMIAGKAMKISINPLLKADNTTLV